jgi:hypothetical protein
MRQRKQKACLINSIHDGDDDCKTTQIDNMRVFTSFMRDKYARNVTYLQARCTLLSIIKSCIPVEAHKDLEHMINIDVLKISFHQRKKRKALRGNGICNEYFQYTWDVTNHDVLKIMNEMYIRGEVLHSPKIGVLVCIPKKPVPKQPTDFRPLTLLNTEFKLLSRIIASRLKKCTPDLLHPYQLFWGT